MKLIFALALVASVLDPSSVERVAESANKVRSAEAVYLDGEWYVALLTDPIYTLSERSELASNVKKKLEKHTGAKSNVLCDSSLYFDIRYYKELNYECFELKQRIKTAFLRRNYDDKGNYITQKEGLESV